MLRPRLTLLLSLEAWKRRKRIECFYIRWFTPGTRVLLIAVSISTNQFPTQKTSSKRNHRYICLSVSIERELGMRCCEAPQMHQINTAQFKTAPVGENGKTKIKHVVFFLIKSGFFFLYNRCAKKGGPKRNKNKNTKCQITKKSYHCRRVLFEK